MKQLIGVAMRTHPAPPFPNIYLAKLIEKQIENLAFKYGKNGKSSILIMNRFPDNIIKVFQGSTKKLHSLLQDMNSIHRTHKFTHTSLVYQNQLKTNVIAHMLIQSLSWTPHLVLKMERFRWKSLETNI